VFHLAAQVEAVIEARILAGFPVAEGWLEMEENVALEDIVFEGIEVLEGVPALDVARASYIADKIFEGDYEALDGLGDLKCVAEDGDVEDTQVVVEREEDDGLEDDSLVAIRNGEDMVDRLEDLCFNVTSHSYKKGRNWSEPIGLDHIVSFPKGLEGRSLVILLSL
jgi:hypothetical protein